MQQGRWVSYIFRYRNNVKCENAGFIKVQRLTNKGKDEARIQIGLKLLKQRACTCMVYLLYNGNHAKPLTEISVRAGERDTIAKCVEIPWEKPLQDGIPFASCDGLVFRCDDGEFLAGLWHESILVPDEVMIDDESACECAEKQTVTQMPSEKEPEAEKTGQRSQREEHGKKHGAKQTVTQMSCEKEPEAEKSGHGSHGEEYGEEQGDIGNDTDACVEMMKTHPRLPLFADSQFLECVKIVPQDIGKLAMSNWKLGINSFLSHGYYHYRYLMLGKVKFENEESYVIGVPGVFTNKEKYLANMFGFNVFIPAKKTNIMTGNFGYWISEVVRE